jgi:soluble lytic murein transglycosylase-like protein
MASPFDSQYNSIRAKVIYYADKYGIDRNVAIWQIWQESKFVPTAHNNSSGADGIAQFVPATAREWSVNTKDVDSSLDGWGRYMVWIGKRPWINNDISLMLAGYNAGIGNVQKYGGIPPFTETKNYVSKILGSADAAAPGSPSMLSGWAAPVLVVLFAWLILD